MKTGPEDEVEDYNDVVEISDEDSEHDNGEEKISDEEFENDNGVEQITVHVDPSDLMGTPIVQPAHDPIVNVVQLEFPPAPISISVPPWSPKYTATKLLTHEETILQLTLPPEAVASIMFGMARAGAQNNALTSLAAAHTAYSTDLIPGNQSLIFRKIQVIISIFLGYYITT